MTCKIAVLSLAAVAAALAADIRVVEEIAAKVNGDIITRASSNRPARSWSSF